jgi:hypothetical protein
MLVIPLALGLAAAGGRPAASLWVIAGMVCVFLARAASIPAAARYLGGRSPGPTQLGSRLAWTFIYLGTAAACFLASGAARRTEFLTIAALPAGLGLVHAGFGLAGHDRRLGAEIVGMAALACAAPLIAAAAGPVGAPAWGAAVLSFLYFLSSLAWVRAFRGIKTTGRLAVAPCLASHAAIGAAAAAVWAVGLIPGPALLALVPVAVRTAWGLRWPPVHLKALGLRELAVAGLFLAIGVAAFRG